MKQIGMFFWLIFVTSGYSQSVNDYSIENVIIDCFYQHHKQLKIEVKDTIDKVENILLKHGVLRDKTGESYVILIQNIKETNDLENDNQNLISEISSIDFIPSAVFCLDSTYLLKMEKVDFSKSKFRYFIGIIDSVQAKGDLSPSSIANEILKVFSAEDFENDFYRTFSLIMFANIINSNKYENDFVNKIRLIPPKDSAIIEEQNLFEIVITKENKIFIDGKFIEIFDLKDRAKKFIIETSDKIDIELHLIGKQKTSKGVISISVEKETLYMFYDKVLKELQKAYQEIWNIYSRKFFKKPFDKLDDEKQKIIKDLVPIRISEAE